MHLLVRGAKLNVCGHLLSAIHAEPSVRIQFGRVCEHIAVFDGCCELSVRLLDGASSSLTCIDGVLVAVGRNSRMPNNVSRTAGSPANTTGMWIVGDAQRGMLGQLAIACGDGLLAASQVASFLET